MNKTDMSSNVVWPCKLPCPDARKLLPSRNGRCPKGLSLLQIAIISVLKGPASECIAYWQIAQIIRDHYKIETSEGAVRGALERLKPRKFLLAKRAAIGKIKGNHYIFNVDPCSYIQPIIFQDITVDPKRAVTEFWETKNG